MFNFNEDKHIKVGFGGATLGFVNHHPFGTQFHTISLANFHFHIITFQSSHMKIECFCLSK
jgi:hypothetical protein